MQAQLVRGLRDTHHLVGGHRSGTVSRSVTHLAQLLHGLGRRHCATIRTVVVVTTAKWVVARKTVARQPVPAGQWTDQGGAAVR